MKRLFGAVCGIALALLVACGRHHTSTTAPPPPPPPEIEAVFPAPRSVSVLYDTEVWAQFRSPLDPATVNARTVFLKLDTRRIACAVSYDAATRRIRIVPQATLGLRHAFTVELTPGIATVDGAPLGSTYEWQFVTIAVRRPEAPAPSDGAVDESPVAALLWNGTESGVGSVAYDVSVGSDSIAVATRSVPSQRVAIDTRVLARSRWGFDTTVYWAVTARNLDTGESLDGPVWRFTTLPSSTPIDSLPMPVSHWEYRRRNSNPTCNGALNSGPDFICMGRWRPDAFSPDLKLAGAALTFTTNNAANPDTRGVSVWAVTADWPICDVVFGGPPFADPELGPLANAEIIFVNGLPSFYRMSSDALASHLEAGIRHHRLAGYQLRSTVNTSYTAPSSNGSNVFMIYYYRMPGPRARAQAARNTKLEAPSPIAAARRSYPGGAR